MISLKNIQFWQYFKISRYHQENFVFFIYLFWNGIKKIYFKWLLHYPWDILLTFVTMVKDSQLQSSINIKLIENEWLQKLPI